jgi:hypothetical protein
VNVTPEVKGRREGSRCTCPDSIVRRSHVSHDAREMRVCIYERIRRLDDFVRHDLLWSDVRAAVVVVLAVLCNVAHVGKE